MVQCLHRGAKHFFRPKVHENATFGSVHAPSRISVWARGRYTYYAVRSGTRNKMSTRTMRNTLMVVLLLAAALGSASAIKCKQYLLEGLESPTAKCTADDITKMATDASIRCYTEAECGNTGTALDDLGTATDTCVRMHASVGGAELVTGECGIVGVNDCASACPGGNCVGGACSECTTVRPLPPPLQVQIPLTV